MNETEQLLKLSVLYANLLQDLEDLAGAKFPSIHQAMQLVDDAVEQACLVKQTNPPLQFKPREFYKGDSNESTRS